MNEQEKYVLFLLLLLLQLKDNDSNIEHMFLLFALLIDLLIFHIHKHTHFMVWKKIFPNFYFEEKISEILLLIVKKIP